MSWASRRRTLYLALVAAVVLLLAAWAAFSYFNKPPSCFDGIQNEKEEGPDCGGPCALLCVGEVHQPVVLWSRAFQTSSSTYAAAAYIENPNVGEGAGAYAVPYAFRLFDSQNILVAEKDGVIDIPPQQTVAVVEPVIDTGSRAVAQAFFEFSSAITWEKIPADTVPTLRITDLSLAQDGSRLSATIHNDGSADIRNLTLDGVLFDASDTAVAASDTLIPDIPVAGSAQAVFTWSNPAQGVVRAEITPSPALSGR